MKASDFAGPRRARSGWWSWGKEKAWLEAWLVLGELMVSRRENFQRVYDLRERVHPPAETLALPSAAAAERALLERSLRGLGVTQARWIHDYFRTRPRRRDSDLEPLLRDGTAVEVAVEGWKVPGYLHRDNLGQARRIASGALTATHSALLSPFDPVVWDRERAASMFGFDYRLECYLPAARRRHGYYVLPILRRGRIVGRLDAKAHRADGLFEVKSLSLEAGSKATDELLHDLAGAIASCASWHGTPEVRLQKTEPARVRSALGALLPSRR